MQPTTHLAGYPLLWKTETVLNFPTENFNWRRPSWNLNISKDPKEIHRKIFLYKLWLKILHLWRIYPFKTLHTCRVQWIVLCDITCVYGCIYTYFTWFFTHILIPKIIQTSLNLFIHSLVLILKQNSDGQPILDQNIDGIQRVTQDLFNRECCTTGHYSAVFDWGYTIHFGSIWLIKNRGWQLQIFVGVFSRHTRQRNDGQKILCQLFGVSIKGYTKGLMVSQVELTV